MFFSDSRSLFGKGKKLYMHTSLLTLFTDQENLTGNLKAEIPDHFPIFTDSTKQRLNRSNKKVSIRK